MSRLEDLQKARDGLVRRMDTCENDQTFSVLVRTLQGVLGEIDELQPPKPKEATGLDEFTRRLRERQSGAARPRRAKQA